MGPPSKNEPKNVHKILLLLALVAVVESGNIDALAKHSAEILNSHLAEVLPPLLKPNNFQDSFIDHKFSNESSSEVEIKSRQKRYLMNLPKGLYFEMEWTIEFPFEAFIRFDTFFQFVWILDKEYPSEILYDTEEPTLHQLYSYKREPLPHYGPHHGPHGPQYGPHHRRRRAAGAERMAMYDAIEHLLTEMGLSGRECLLRSVCEVAEAPFEEANLLGRGLNTLLRPSEGYHHSHSYKEMINAEKEGHKTGSCKAYHAGCPESVFNSLPFIKHSFSEY